MSERLLDAGTDILAEDAFAVLAAGMSADRIARRAGRGRRTFYDHFETKEDFARQVLARALDEAGTDTLNEAFVPNFTATLDEARGDLLASVTAMIGLFYNPEDHRTETRLFAMAWSIGATDPTLNPHILAHETRSDQTYIDAIEAGLELWQARLRSPWTPRLLSMTIRAVGDSFYQRNAIRPGSVGAEEYTTILSTIFGAVLQPGEARPESVGDHLRSLSRTAADRWEQHHQADKITNAHQRVVEAFTAELQHRSVTDLGLADLAAVTGLPVDTLVTIFGSVGALLDEVVRAGLPPLEQEADFDLHTDTLDIEMVLRRHLLRLTRWAQESPHLAESLVALFGRGRPERSMVISLVADMSRPAIQIIERAHELGFGGDPSRIADTALLATESLLLRVVGHHGAAPIDAEAVVDWLTELILATPARDRAAGDTRA